MMGALSPDIRPRLAKLVPLLGSDRPGEVAATVLAIANTLRSAGNDWHDMAADLACRPAPQILYRPQQTTSPTWSFERREQCRQLLQAGISMALFDDWSDGFARDIVATIQFGSTQFTSKQQSKIDRLLRIVQEARS